MTEQLQVLLLEDDPDDADLLVGGLEQDGFDVEWRRVSTEEDLRRALTPQLDVILVDLALPTMSGIDAIRTVRAWHPTLPVIVVTGSAEDARAVESLRVGANDYILKDRLARLGPAVRRARRERQTFEEREKAIADLERSEQQMRDILGTIEDVVWSLSVQDNRLLYLNPAAERLTGRRIKDFFDDPDLWLRMVHPEDRERMAESEMAALRWGAFEDEFRLIRPDGSMRHVVVRAWAAYDKTGTPKRLEGIFSDVTEERAAEEARQNAQEADRERGRLEQLNAYKSRYIHMIAHELNNVISPMILYLDLMALDKATNLTTVQRRSLSALERGVHRLEGFLADLLDAARLQGGQLVIRPAPFDLAAVVRDVVADLTVSAHAEGVELAAEVPARLVVTADRQRLEQVVTNVVGNALKFTPRGGKVRVTLETAKDELRLHVEDCGPGVPDEAVERLFEPFAAIADAPQGKHTGTGLGLFICRGIVEQHGGHILYRRSEDLGGAEFVVVLPIEPRR